MTYLALFSTQINTDQSWPSLGCDPISDTDDMIIMGLQECPPHPEIFLSLALSAGAVRAEMLCSTARLYSRFASWDIL